MRSGDLVRAAETFVDNPFYPSFSQKLCQLFEDRAPDIVGLATDLDSGELLYEEHYYCSEDASACSVFYLDPGGDLIASKTIDYQLSLQAPGLAFRDYRFDREIELLPERDDWVVDAGFDNFVRTSWGTLVAGDTVRFPMQLLGRDKPLDMKAALDDRGECPEAMICFEVQLDSWLLGALIDPIRLQYDRDSQRLMRFTGISNLRSDSDRSQSVDILYRYAPEAAPSPP